MKPATRTINNSTMNRKHGESESGHIVVFGGKLKLSGKLQPSLVSEKCQNRKTFE